MHRFGMDDASTGAMLVDLMARRALPDFTIAYFADNDYRSHEVGPVRALTALDRIDAMLAEAFEAGGGLDQVLADTTIVITSDHGHCDVLPESDRAVIHLDALLSTSARRARKAVAGAGRNSDLSEHARRADLRARGDAVRMARIIAALLRESRLDQVIWRTRLTRDGAAGYTVASQRGRLEFARGGDAGSCADVFGGSWTWSGDPQALGLEVDGPTVLFSDYPNAFERIAGVWTSIRAARSGSPPGPDANSKCRVERRTSAAPRTARCTSSTR